MNNIATALLRKEQPRAARQVLARSLELGPTAEGYARLGWAYLQEGRADSARMALERSLAVTASTEALYYRGQLAREEGRIDAAIADWERGLELNPDPAQREILYYVLGRVYVESGRDPQRALEYLNRITRRFPDLDELRSACRAAGAR
jgi:tetratricopeptide (TPR) repeat protein